MTVTPPRGICASPPRNAPSAAARTCRGSPAVFREASHVASAKRMPIAATTRLPNSTNAWNPSSGYGVSPQRGQFSQPRPEPVSRTNAPDVTTTSIAPSEIVASLRKRFGVTPWSLDSRSNGRRAPPAVGLGPAARLGDRRRPCVDGLVSHRARDVVGRRADPRDRSARARVRARVASAPARLRRLARCDGRWRCWREGRRRPSCSSPPGLGYYLRCPPF